MDRKFFKMLCDNFGKTLNADLYELFDNELKDYDPILVERAVKKILDENKFFPTLSDIKNIIKDLPELKISDEEKIKRWNSKGIQPSWLNEEQEIEEITEEELEELKDLLKDFK